MTIAESKKRLVEIKERLVSCTEGEWICDPRNLCFYEKVDNIHKLAPQTNELYLNAYNQNGDILGADIEGIKEPIKSSFTVRDAWFIANAKKDIQFLLDIIEEELIGEELPVVYTCKPEENIG